MTHALGAESIFSSPLLPQETSVVFFSGGVSRRECGWMGDKDRQVVVVLGGQGYFPSQEFDH